MKMYAKKNPYNVVVKAGESVAICQCGHTNDPPFCDGSHKAHPPKKPLTQKSETDTALYICGCGTSKGHGKFKSPKTR